MKPLKAGKGPDAAFAPDCANLARLALAQEEADWHTECELFGREAVSAGLVPESWDACAWDDPLSYVDDRTDYLDARSPCSHEHQEESFARWSEEGWFTPQNGWPQRIQAQQLELNG